MASIPQRASPSSRSAATAMLVVVACIALLVRVEAGGKCTSPVTIPAAGNPGPRTLLEVVQQCDCGGSTPDSQYQKALALCRSNIDLIRARSWNATCRTITDNSAFVASQCCNSLVAGTPLELPKECTNEEQKQRQKEKADDRKNLVLKIVGSVIGGVIAAALVWLAKRWWKRRTEARAAKADTATAKNTGQLDV